MYVYKITNQITNKCYIGITTREVEKRWYEHRKYAINHVHTKLYDTINSYGIQNFLFEKIDETDSIDELREKEIYYIQKYDSYNNGYNMTLGGDINPMNSEEVLKIHNDKMRSDEVRLKISNSMKKYRQSNPFTDEHRKNLSESMKGNHNFGTGDTRSIECYCIDENNTRHDFHNIKQATVWLFDNYKPCGDKYVLITLQRKIRKSMLEHIEICNTKWFENDKKCVETIERVE